MFFEPRLIKRVFLHNEVDDVSGDVFAIYIFPALAVRPWGIGGGGMHADAEDEGEYGYGKSQFACGGVPGSEVWRS